MTDVVARIREHINDPIEVALRPMLLARAIEAVLTAHTPRVSPPGVGHCARCGQPAPCHTVRVVASGLGVLEDEEG